MNPKLDTSWTLSKLCLLAMTLLLVPATVLALQFHETGIPFPGSQEIITAATVDEHNSVQLLSTGNFEIRKPIGRILEREIWPDPDLPSAPTGIFLPAGDLNGDGRNDLMQTRLRLADLRTDNLSDLSDRTLIYYSGSFTGNHDQVIYDDMLLPAGDLTGDGKANLLGQDIFGNTTVYSHDGTTLQAASATTQVTLPADLTVTSSQWGTDIDGDGFEDFVFTLSPSGYPDAGFELFVLYGGNLDSELGVGVYDTRTILPAELDGMRLTAVTDVFELDGAIHIILSMQSTFSRRFAVILSIDEARTVSFIQAIQLTDYNHFRAGLIFTATLSSGGDPHLVASDFGFRPDRSFYFPPSAEEGEIFSDVPIALHPFRVWPAGDLNNDGTTNFLANESATGPLRFGGFPNGIAEGFTLGDHFPGFGTDVRLLTGDLFEFGDLTGDGSDNLIYSFIGGANSAAGVIRVAGSEGGVLSSEEFFYDEESFPFRANTAYALGDFTGNGNDDFAVSFSQAFLGSGKLNFYEGGSNWQTPAASWTMPANKSVIDIVSGRFTDPDRLDLVILFAETPDLSTPQLRTNVLELYTGGILPGQAPDRILRDSDAYPGLAHSTGAINTITKAGDVTNSGYDDLLIASANVANDQNLGPLPALLYAGGPSFMDGSPDAAFNFPAEDLGFGIGGALTGLGDINGDGIDDFAITNLNQGASADFAEYGTGRLGGRIHIYFGRDGDTHFGEPDITLRADRESIVSGNDMWLFGMSAIATGDFLGTGNRGLVAKPFQHHKRADATVGVAGVHVFQRNLLDEDPQPDQLLPLHSSIMAINPTSEFIPFMGWALMSGIPDLTSNGRDELLIIGSAGHTNAVLHYGRDPLSPVPDVVFESPNSSITMGAPGNFINRQYRTAVGDFNGDGKLNFLAVQNDTNFPDSPVYLYELGRAGGVQVQVTKTEPIDSGGGTIEDEETNTTVVIPEDALDSEVEIEIGTFPVTPEGADVAGVMVYLGPSGTTFSEPVEVTVGYDPDNLPDGVAEEDLVLLRYDEATSEWEELLPSTVNTEEKTVTGFTTQFSGFGAGALKIPTSFDRTDRTDDQVPGSIALHQNYPNPFNPVTNIRWELNGEQHVLLTVYDLLGRKVMELANGVYPAGIHTVAFDAGNLASGIYLYRLEAGSVMLHRKMTVVK